MATVARPGSATHEVFNQAPPLGPVDLFSSDLALVEGAEREGAGAWAGELAAHGRVWGDRPLLELAAQANDNPPKLKVVDRFGQRLDEVEFHPAWHELMRLDAEAGFNTLPWTSDRSGRFVARTAAGVVSGQVEAGHGCPMTMTFAVVPALRHSPELAAQWEPLLTAPAYDPELRPRAEKTSAKAGMGMTEKQGGSDVRANTTTATPQPDGSWELRGHKWFTSAPMCDVFLVLAQTDEGLGCFLVPRILDDGTRNVFRIQRLKDKLGDRSNASSEVEFDGTVGWLVGEPGRGVRTIIDMVGHTRLDCVTGSAALMRGALAHAAWHAAHRSAFGRLLADQPLMRNVLADLALETEAAVALALRLARAYDEDDGPLKRLGTAVGKFWVCKRTPAMVAEAMECLGGNGFVEESGMPRLFRQSPLNSIWEGSGNVNALDVLRALGGRGSGSHVLEAFFAELDVTAGADARLDAFVAGLRGEFADLADVEVRARRIVERLALAWQGSLLVRGAPAAVADAFCASRLAGDAGLAFGTLPRGTDLATIVQRATPAVAA
jgi:putative acyl-CoA dehydrogenase